MLFLLSALSAQLFVTATAAESYSAGRKPDRARLTSVECSPERVDITVDGPVMPTIFRLPSPPRLVLDFPNVAAFAFPPARLPPGGTVLAVRAAGRDRNARVVIELSRDIPFTLQTEARGVSVSFDPAVTGARPARMREFHGFVVDGSGRPLDGTFLITFSLLNEESEASKWEEAAYVEARHGRFTAVLGHKQPLPSRALRTNVPIIVIPPPGVPWRVLPR